MYRGGVALLALTIAGCASVDKPLLDAQLPDAPQSWTADDDATATPTGDWVAAFGDNALRSLISEAMVHNNNLLAAASNLKAARANAKVTRANLLPSLNSSFNSSRNAIVVNPTSAAQAGGAGAISGNANDLIKKFGVDRDGDGRLDGLDFDGDGFAEAPIPDKRFYINNFALGAQFQWEIDLWGRLTDETRASYKDARANYADLRGARLSLAASVAEAWFGLIEARQQRELADRDTAARESNLRVTERRYNRGVASSLDVRLARSALGTSRANRALRQRLEKEASRRIEVLLGRYPSAEVEAAEDLPALPALHGAGAPGELLERRPDVVAAEARMEAAGLRARAARKQLLPRLTLSSQINTSGPDLSDVLDPTRLAGNIASGVFQPLFQGGRLIAGAKRQSAVAEAALYSYTQTVLNAYEEAENAIAAEDFLAAREDALNLAYKEAAAAEELTERRYASGAATIFNLLDAQTRRISAESLYIQAKQDRVSNRVRLYLAIGGDFLTEQQMLAAADAGGGE